MYIRLLKDIYYIIIMNNTYKTFIRVYKTFFYFIIELNTNNYYIIYILDILDFIKTIRKYIVLDFFLTALKLQQKTYLIIPCL